MFDRDRHVFDAIPFVCEVFDNIPFVCGKSSGNLIVLLGE
ncbi:hypothetical protein FG94_04936 [Massilia sp. LC238]|nr:hypothetical protein FG94_04936 [Massilia sp. LC238]